jgi:hypothetical protein
VMAKQQRSASADSLPCARAPLGRLEPIVVRAWLSV